jgi:hypothetical protein
MTLGYWSGLRTERAVEDFFRNSRSTCLIQLFSLLQMRHRVPASKFRTEPVYSNCLQRLHASGIGPTKKRDELAQKHLSLSGDIR